MADIKIENIIVSASVAKSLDLPQLSEDMPDSKYNPDEVPTLFLHIEDPKTAAILFSNGKAIIIGSKSIEEAESVVKTITERLNALILKVNKKPEIKIENIVGSTEMNKNLDLQKISEVIKGSKYNPEVFPGLIYKTDNPNIVILVFNSGKIVCNGTDSEEITSAIKKLTDELSSVRLI